MLECPPQLTMAVVPRMVPRAVQDCIDRPPPHQTTSAFSLGGILGVLGVVQHCYSTGGRSCNPRQLTPELILPTMGLAAPPMNRLPPTTMGNTLDMSRLQYLPQGSGRESSWQRWKGEMLQVMMQITAWANDGCDGLAAPPIDPRAPTSTVYALDRPRLQYQPMGSGGERCRHDGKVGYCRGCSCRAAALTVPAAANRGLRYGCDGIGLTVGVCTVRCPVGLLFGGLVDEWQPSLATALAYAIVPLLLCLRGPFCVAGAVKK